jgi:hypothetical protein
VKAAPLLMEEQKYQQHVIKRMLPSLVWIGRDVDDIQQLLLDNEAQINLTTLQDKFNGQTLLHDATLFCGPDLIQLLVDRYGLMFIVFTFMD